ncbi:hypothetical protein [Radiobacillus deserti]|uniref:Uncharacterized protein n=1 Tax=Radiobacillus deserti TaxID=2594883 RepID=A0A516KED0_9BACI|nr:hypothetical protein [Radiobacillus deserti]QDP39762.1 hypothetical protein FN924_05985 [Radiobacillus deserti]
MLIELLKKELFQRWDKQDDISNREVQLLQTQMRSFKITQFLAVMLGLFLGFVMFLSMFSTVLPFSRELFGA